MKRAISLIFIKLSVLLAISAVLTSCGSIKQVAISELSGTFASDKAMQVYASDNDPELVWSAMPFALKTIEMLLANDQNNTELLEAAAKGFIIYAHGNLALKARKLENIDYKKSKVLSKRAHNLSIRGRNYALKALDIRYPGIQQKLLDGETSALADVSAKDIPLLYWTALGWAGAAAMNPGDMERLAELPVAETLMRKVLELDESYQNGAVHEFFIAYEAARASGGGGSYKKAKEHFDRAVELGKGLSASPYVIYADSFAVKKQDMKLFEKLLHQALAVKQNEDNKDLTLLNTIAKDKASWLLEQEPELFFEFEENDK